MNRLTRRLLMRLNTRPCAGVSVSTGLRCAGRAPRRRGVRLCTHHLARANATPAAALTAAVANVQVAGVGWQTWRPGNRTWQTEGWRQYDITGQLRFVANWVAHSVSRCRLYVAQVDESGEATTEAEDPAVAALAAGPLGSGPAKDDALRLCALQLFVPGEGYIVAQADAGPEGDDLWFVVSGSRIRRSGDQIIIRRPLVHGGGEMVFRPGVDLIIRLWTPHPEDPDEPDSPTRSAIPDLREIEAIRKREFAELDSRLAGAGLLALPQGIDFPRNPGDPPDAASFTRLLGQTMGISLSDRASAEAMVPIIFTVPPGTSAEQIKLLTFWSELSAELLPMKEAAIRSLAQSLDVPAEILLGQADSNHWTAWQVSEDAVSTQIVPILSRIADALTTGYLKAALEAMGLDPTKYVYAFDTAPLTARPNRSADALNYHAANLLSDEAAVEAGAFTAEQMPTGDELLRRLAFQVIAANPAMINDPTWRALIGITTPAPMPAPAETPPAEQPPGEQPTPAETPPANPIQEPRTPPQQPTPQTEQGAVIPFETMASAVAGSAVRRALTLAGSRLVPHNQRDRYGDGPRWALHTHIGPVEAARADRLLAGAWDDLPELAADLAMDALRLHDVLHGYTLELLTRGMAYDPADLRHLLAAAHRQMARPAALAAA